MSSYILPRETWTDLLAWFTHGKMPMQTWGNARPGEYLLDRMKYADQDILPAGTVGHWAEASAAFILLQQKKGRKPGREPAEAAAIAVCHALYLANCLAFAGRYKVTSETDTGWADILLGMGQADPFQVVGWKAENAMGILACWDYQCAEDVAVDQRPKHNAIRYGVADFRLQIAEAIIGKPERGWVNRMAG